ncbi:MAG: nitrate reductase molybdenum cofactor assembly chaperone [Firmicutes bacterium]|nr:nitrate reductase molybdenum cofactor assembly chaperone [Bacillota bacterium]
MSGGREPSTGGRAGAGRLPEPGRLREDLAALASLLAYPGEEQAAVARELGSRAGRLRERLEPFLAWVEATPLARRQERYVADFDFRAETTLHLTYHRFGDRRVRGTALVALKQVYASAGYAVPEGELPDHLPLLLEFAAREPALGLALLERLRAPVRLVGERLREAGSPYAAAVEAVLDLLPPAPPEAEAEIEALRAGPPAVETVGLDAPEGRRAW